MADRDTDPRKKDAPVENDAGIGALPAFDEKDVGELPSLAIPDEPGVQLAPDEYRQPEESIEDATVRTEEFLTEQVGPQAARDIVQPNASAIDSNAGQTLGDIWSTEGHIPPAEMERSELAAEYRDNYASYGGNPATLDEDMLMTEADRIARLAGQGAAAIGGALAESRSWWSGVKRGFADTGARVMSNPDFQVGLQTLDFFTFINKKTKLAFVPREERAEIEQRVLPKVTLSDGSSYTVATGQAIENIWDRMWGANTQINGWALRNAGKLLRSDALQEIGQSNQRRGAAMRETASENISEAASLLGQHLTWTEVVESNDPGLLVISAQMANAGLGELGLQATPDEWEQVYNEVVQAGSTEPLYAFLGSKGSGGSAVLGVWAAVDGVAELALDPTVIAGEAIAKGPVAVRGITAAVAPAKHAVVASKVAHSTKRFEDAIDAVRAAENHVASVERTAIEQANRTGQISREQAINVANARRQLANEQVWMSRFKDAGPNEVIIPRSRRTAPEHPSVDMKVTQEYVEQYPAINRKTGQFEMVEVKGEYVRNKTTTELADELHDIRVKELGRDADIIQPRTDQTENLPLFGMDDTEQVGDALNHITRTGGIGIDDVWMNPTNPHHAILPDSQFGLIDWRALDTANDVTKAERQYLSSGGGRQYALGHSTRRSLHRNHDIIKRNYGLARSNKNKEAIAVYERELKLSSEAIKRAKNDEVLKAADKAMGKGAEDLWLGGKQGNPMDSPKTFNQRLDDFGDTMLATAYPGGFGVRALQRSRIGQAIIPFREPQRFYETFKPETWERVQGLYTRYQQSNRAWNESLIRNGETAGLLTKRSKWDPKSHFSPYKVDEAKNELLFDLLNTRLDAEEFAGLAAQADDGLMRLHDDVRKQMDHWADMQGIGKGPDSPRYLDGYMRHAITADQFAGGARPIEYIGVPRSANQYVSHLLPRTGEAGAFRKDAMSVLDLYGRASNRKMLIEPMFDEILMSGKELAEEFANPIMQQYANDLVAELGGKPTPWMARVDQFMGWAHEGMVPTIKRRPTEGGGMTRLPRAELDRKWNPGRIDRALTGLSGLLWAGTLPGNPRYGLMQIATGIATTSGRYGLFRTTKGLFQQATAEGRAISKAAGTYDEFLNIFESDSMRKFSKTMAEKGYSFSPMGVMSTGQAEEFIRGMTFHAAVDMHMTKLGISTWGEAVALGYGKRIVAEGVRSSMEVNHMFGAMGRSPMMTRGLFQSKGLATSTTQFLSFMPKQTEELVSQANRNPGYIARYMAMSGAMSRIAAESGGIDITNYVGLGYAPTNPVDDLQSPLMDALVEGMGVLYSAGVGDRQAMSDHGKSLLDGLDNLIPMMVAWESASKGAQRIMTGQDISGTGKLNRSLDMGEFLEDPSVESFMSALGPSGVRGDEAMAPTTGGDLFPALFGQQSINDRLFRRGKEAMSNTIDRYLFEVSARVRDLTDALQDDEPAEAERIVELLRTDFNIFIDPDRALSNRIYAENLGAVFRTLKDRSPGPVKKEVYDHIINFGLKIE